MGVRAILSLLETHGGSRTNIVLVDGCYRHPIQADNYTSGAFEIPDLPENGLAVYAASFGETLEPPAEGTSPFSKAINGLSAATSPAMPTMAPAVPFKKVRRVIGLYTCSTVLGLTSFWSLWLIVV